MHERRTRQGGLRGGSNVRKRTGADRREKSRTVRRPLFPIDRTYRQSKNLRLETTHECALRPATREQHVARRHPKLVEDGDGITKREAHTLDHCAREVRA